MAKDAVNDGICYECETAIEKKSDLYVTHQCKHEFH
jgi:hypothetical protein